MARHHFRLTKQDIKEFQDLYRDAYGVSLNDEEAEEYALCFLEFMRVMMY